MGLMAVASHFSSSQASNASSQLQDTFFNVKELESLQAILAGSPSTVLVLLGPPSCGKSGAHACLCGWCLCSPRPAAVLRQLRKLSEKVPKPITIVDLRAGGAACSSQRTLRRP